MLRRLFRRRKFERQLFRFHDGQATRSVDPLLAAQMLSMHAEFRPEHLAAAYSGDVIAQQICAKTSRDVFDLAVWDEATGNGCTESEAIDILLLFDRYLAALKKNTSPLSTSPPSTAATSPSSSEPNTSASSPSGSADNGQPSEPPTPSDSEPSPPIPAK